MILKNYRFITLSVLFLILSILSCRKTEQQAIITHEDITAKFFEQKGVIPQQLIPVITDLKKKAEKNDFITKLVSKAGYPQWHYSKAFSKKLDHAYRSTEDGNGIIYTYTPFVSNEFQNVQAVLITRQENEKITYKFMLADYYKDFPTTSIEGSATATDVAKLFFTFEHSIFGHSAMEIKDRDKLFLLSSEQIENGYFVPSVSIIAVENKEASREVSITTCTEIWYDPDGDDDPCDCSGNEYFHHYECTTIVIFDGNDGGGGGGSVGGGGSFNYPGGQNFTDYPEEDIHNFHNQTPMSTLAGWGVNFMPFPLKNFVQSLNQQQLDFWNNTANSQFVTMFTNYLIQQNFSSSTQVFVQSALSFLINNYSVYLQLSNFLDDNMYSEDAKNFALYALPILVDGGNLIIDDLYIETPTPDDNYNYLGAKNYIPNPILLSNGDMVSVTFGTTNSDNQNANQLVAVELINALKYALNKANNELSSSEKITSIHIMATSNGAHSPTSNHANGTAVDISRINGVKMVTSGVTNQIEKLQEAFDQFQYIRENFGPSFKHKYFIESNSWNYNFNVGGHKDHIHISIRKP